MISLKDEWNLAMALEVLGSETVDSRTWAGAVRWLLFYGPPEIRDLISRASWHASAEHFPDLKAAGYDDDGQPLYTLHDLAESLGITPGEALQQVRETENAAERPQSYRKDEVKKLQ